MKIKHQGRGGSMRPSWQPKASSGPGLLGNWDLYSDALTGPGDINRDNDGDLVAVNALDGACTDGSAPASGSALAGNDTRTVWPAWET
jgi:hypothetical protein